MERGLLRAENGAPRERERAREGKSERDRET
jgi:hypothetical protein